MSSPNQFDINLELIYYFEKAVSFEINFTYFLKEVHFQTVDLLVVKFVLLIVTLQNLL